MYTRNSSVDTKQKDKQLGRREQGKAEYLSGITITAAATAAITASVPSHPILVKQDLESRQQRNLGKATTCHKLKAYESSAPSMVHGVSIPENMSQSRKTNGRLSTRVTLK